MRFTAIPLNMGHWIALLGTTWCTDVFSLQLILDQSECPLNVILFFSPALKPQLQRIGHRWRHHPSSHWRSARALWRFFKLYLSLKNHTITNTHKGRIHRCTLTIHTPICLFINCCSICQPHRHWIFYDITVSHLSCCCTSEASLTKQNKPLRN